VPGETRDVSAWKWATSLSQLAQLHGFELCGHVASAAYGFRSLHDLSFDEHSLVGRSSSESLILVKPKQARIVTRSSGFVQSRFTSLEQESMHAFEPNPVPLAAPTNMLEDGVTLLSVPELGRCPSTLNVLDECVVENDEDEDDKERRREWIQFYVGMGQFEDALDIGWDLITPPDPRQRKVGLGLTDDHLSAASTSAHSDSPSPETERHLRFDQKAFSFLRRRIGGKHAVELHNKLTSSPVKPRPRWQGFLSFGMPVRTPKTRKFLPSAKAPDSWSR